MVVFARMKAGLAAQADAPKTVVIDATHLKAYRTTSSPRLKQGATGAARAPLRPPEGRAQQQVPCGHGQDWAAHPLLPDR